MMQYLKTHKVCPNGLSYFIVPMQNYSICNLKYLLKINEIVEPRLVSNAIYLCKLTLQYFMLVSVLNIKQIVVSSTNILEIFKTVKIWSNLLEEDAERCSQHYLNGETERHINVRSHKQSNLTALSEKRVCDIKKEVPG